MKNNLSLSNLSVETLRQLQEHLQTFLFSRDLIGEEYHKDYKKNKPLFKKLVRSTVRLDRSIEAYFADQWKRIYTLVNITKIQASAVEDEYINIEYWKEDNKTFSAQIEFDIGQIFEIGAAATDQLFKTSIGLNRNDSAVQKFLSKYTLDLAGQINGTTKDRIVEQIKTSLKLGENRDQLSARIEEIVLDSKRAVKIAQTESIRAYAEGTLATGQRIGAKQKKWLTTVDPCPICQSFDGMVIDIDEQFGGTYNCPPAHPHCRCLLQLVVDPADINWDNVGKPTL